PGFAPMASLALVLAPPVVIFSVVCYFVDKWHLNRMPSRHFVPIMMWVAFAIATTHYLSLSAWAAGRLRKSFRTVVTSRFQPPPPKFWWLPSRRTVWRVGISIAGVAALVAIIVASFYGYQNWRSRRAWSAFQNGLKQRNKAL